MLGIKLAGSFGEDAVMLGLARGGVAVAAAAAKELRCILDALVVRKVGAPFQPELGLGAVAPDGIEFLDLPRTRSLGVGDLELREGASQAREELQRQSSAYQPYRKPVDLRGRHVILVDDGLATGVTAIAALRWARSKEPAGLVFAAPIASTEGMRTLADEADEVAALIVSDSLVAVGGWYEDFTQVSDEDVIALLQAG